MTTALPQLTDAVFLTDSGLETDLVFSGGWDLPDFAAYPLLDRDDGRAALRAYVDAHLRVAQEELGDDGREQLAEQRERGHAQRAVGRAARLAHRPVHRPRLGDEPGAVRVVLAPGLGEAQPARVALQQPGAQPLLQGRQTPAHRGLAQPQPCRRRGDAPRAHYLGEDEHVIEQRRGRGHGRASLRLPSRASPSSSREQEKQVFIDNQ